jgi:hypothetical protein
MTVFEEIKPQVVATEISNEMSEMVIRKASGESQETSGTETQKTSRTKSDNLISKAAVS